MLGQLSGRKAQPRKQTNNVSCQCFLPLIEFPSITPPKVSPFYYSLCGPCTSQTPTFCTVEHGVSLCKNRLRKPLCLPLPFDSLRHNPHRCSKPDVMGRLSPSAGTQAGELSVGLRPLAPRCTSHFLITIRSVWDWTRLCLHSSYLS